MRVRLTLDMERSELTYWNMLASGTLARTTCGGGRRRGEGEGFKGQGSKVRVQAWGQG